MNTINAVEANRLSTRKRAGFLAALLTVTVGLPGMATGAVRTEFPSETPGPPYYARVEPAETFTMDIVPHDEEWGAVVFYRSPVCVPENFNLMEVFDVPAAFGCSLTVDGFERWRNGPPPEDNAPMFVKSDGLGATPVWFASWPDIEAAVADGVLTIEELEALPSLRMGTALVYRESLFPEAGPGGIGGAEDPKISIRAFGLLDDGRSFELRHFGREGRIVTTIRID